MNDDVAGSICVAGVPADASKLEVVVDVVDFDIPMIVIVVGMPVEFMRTHNL